MNQEWPWKDEAETALTNEEYLGTFLPRLGACRHRRVREVFLKTSPDGSKVLVFKRPAPCSSECKLGLLCGVLMWAAVFLYALGIIPV